MGLFGFGKKEKDKMKDGLEKTRTGFWGNILNTLTGSKIDDDLYDELEEQLILADVGGEVAIKLVDKGRGRPGALVAMFKQLDALGGVDPRYGYTLLYSDNKQLIAPVHHYMHQNLQLTGGRVAQLGPTIGTHVGPGVVGVVFVAKE
jgi:hypothetical protein